MLYKAAKGSHISNEDAQMYGERIAALIEEHNGKINPEIVLEDAKSPKSPLHDFFEWNNTNAANEYRLYKARILVASIKVIIKREELPIDQISVTVRKTERPEETRAFPLTSVIVNVDSDNGDEQEHIEHHHTTIQNVLSDEKLRSQMIEKAKRELESWCRRYGIYDELDWAIFEVGKIAEEIVA